MRFATKILAGVASTAVVTAVDYFPFEFPSECISAAVMKAGKECWPDYTQNQNSPYFVQSLSCLCDVSNPGHTAFMSDRARYFTDLQCIAIDVDAYEQLDGPVCQWYYENKNPSSTPVSHVLHKSMKHTESHTRSTVTRVHKTSKSMKTYVYSSEASKRATESQKDTTQSHKPTGIIESHKPTATIESHEFMTAAESHKFKETSEPHSAIKHSESSKSKENAKSHLPTEHRESQKPKETTKSNLPTEHRESLKPKPTTESHLSTEHRESKPTETTQTPHTGLKPVGSVKFHEATENRKLGDTSKLTEVDHMTKRTESTASIKPSEATNSLKSVKPNERTESHHVSGLPKPTVTSSESTKAPKLSTESNKFINHVKSVVGTQTAVVNKPVATSNSSKSSITQEATKVETLTDLTLSADKVTTSYTTVGAKETLKLTETVHITYESIATISKPFIEEHTQTGVMNKATPKIVATTSPSCVPKTVTATSTITVTVAASTPANSPKPNATTCISGTYKCENSGVSPKFTVCANEKIIENHCAAGTVCKTFENSIICDWA